MTPTGCPKNRFITADPILATGDPQQTNGYEYANSNLITLTDPTGLDPAMPACNMPNAFSYMAACENYYNGGEFNGKSYDPNTSDPIGAHLASADVPGDLNITAAEACGWNSSCVNSQPDRYSAGPDYNPAPGSLTKCEEACRAIATFTALTLLTIALPEIGVPADIAEASVPAAEEAATALTEREIGSTMDDILGDATFRKQIDATQYDKPGGFSQANSDFDALTRGVKVAPRENGLRTATPSNGTKVNVRPFSSGGKPTLEVDTPGNPVLKIRYPDDATSTRN